MTNYTEREELILHVYEGHKDAFGVKGRHYDFANMTIEQLRDESDRIQEAVEAAIQEEEIRQLEALADFETEIDNICHRNPNASRETAIRWILDARGMLDETDPDYICFILGLSYQEAHVFEQACSVARANLLNPQT